MADFSFIETTEYKEFIREYQNHDTLKLRLKEFRNLPFDKEFAIRQIECLKKAKDKIPELSELWIYPTSLSIEQCTPEIVARFNASLFKGCENVVDFTCGLGIDSYYISKEARHLTTIDINPDVADAAIFNFRNAQADNITVMNTDSERYASNMDWTFSAAFIDQSRRGEGNARIYDINECVPSITKIINAISDKTNFLIAKTSPMIDITATIRQFNCITDVWVISLKNECKELLFKFDFKSIDKERLIHTINFEQDSIQEFSLRYGNENLIVENRTPQQDDIIALPNSSIMKAGVFNQLCKAYSLTQISSNSHIFICDSQTQTKEFPGKTYKIIQIFTLSKADIKKLNKTIDHANISCRNFPLSPDELYKRLKIKTGGSAYIFATTTDRGEKILLLCKKTGTNA